MTLENTINEGEILKAVGFGMKDFLSDNLGRATNAETRKEKDALFKTLDTYMDNHLKEQGFSWYQRKTKGRKIKAQARELLEFTVENYSNAIHNVMVAETPREERLVLSSLVLNSLHDFNDYKDAQVAAADKKAERRQSLKTKTKEAKAWYTAPLRWAAAPIIAAIGLLGTTCQVEYEEPGQKEPPARVRDISNSASVPRSILENNNGKKKSPGYDTTSLNTKVSKVAKVDPDEDVAGPNICDPIDDDDPTLSLIDRLVDLNPCDPVAYGAVDDGEGFGFPIAMDRQVQIDNQAQFYTDASHDVKPSNTFVLDGEITIVAGLDKTGSEKHKYQQLYDTIVTDVRAKKGAEAKVKIQDALEWFYANARTAKGLKFKDADGKAYEWAKKEHGINLDRLALHTGFNSDGVWRRYTEFTVENLGDDVPSDLLAMARKGGYLNKKKHSSSIALKAKSNRKLKKQRPKDFVTVSPFPNRHPKMKIRTPKLSIGSIFPRPSGRSLRPEDGSDRGRIIPFTHPDPNIIPQRETPKTKPEVNPAEKARTLDQYVNHVNKYSATLATEYRSITAELGWLTGTTKGSDGKSLPDLLRQRCKATVDNKGNYQIPKPASSQCKTTIYQGYKKVESLAKRVEILAKGYQTFIRDATFLHKQGREVNLIDLDMKLLKQVKSALLKHQKMINQYNNTANKVSDLRKEYGSELDKVIAAYGVQTRSQTLADKRDERLFAVRDLYDSGVKASDIAKQLNVSRSTVYKDLKKARDTPYAEMEMQIAA